MAELINTLTPQSEPFLLFPNTYSLVLLCHPSDGIRADYLKHSRQPTRFCKSIVFLKNTCTLSLTKTTTIILFFLVPCFIVWFYCTSKQGSLPPLSPVRPGKRMFLSETHRSSGHFYSFWNNVTMYLRNFCPKIFKVNYSLGLQPMTLSKCLYKTSFGMLFSLFPSDLQCMH